MEFVNGAGAKSTGKVFGHVLTVIMGILVMLKFVLK